jgi:hypothetical protein
MSVVAILELINSSEIFEKWTGTDVSRERLNSLHGYARPCTAVHCCVLQYTAMHGYALLEAGRLPRNISL